MESAMTTYFDAAFLRLEERQNAKFEPRIDAAQRDAAKALGIAEATRDSINGSIRAAVDELKRDGRERSDELAAQIREHQAVIVRVKNYERIALTAADLIALIPYGDLARKVVGKLLGKVIGLGIAVGGGIVLGALVTLIAWLV